MPVWKMNTTCYSKHHPKWQKKPSEETPPQVARKPVRGIFVLIFTAQSTVKVIAQANVLFVGQISHYVMIDEDLKKKKQKKNTTPPPHKTKQNGLNEVRRQK